MTIAQLNNGLSAESKRIVGYICELAGSQGMYGRLKESLCNAGAERSEAWLKQFHGCRDAVDFVMAYECGV